MFGLKSQPLHPKSENHRSRIPFSLAIVGLFSLPLLTQSVLASPSIDGNTISWPDDGWYQVQSGLDYTTLCNGGSSCDVPTGIYNVINHTTGQRWEHLSVGASGPVVLDIWIKLPSDGWYEVQTADTYTTVCQGIPVCDVVPGRYNVINHTTGQRWENLLVESDRVADAPTVSGNRITWTGDDWYQVLRADDYAPICEGGSFCDVVNGDYLVINHWTAQRWEITVNGSASPGLMDSDGDLIADINDNCPLISNSDQADSDGDGIGNVCETLDDPTGPTTDIALVLADGEEQTININVDVPDPGTGDIGGDFMVLFDRTGSFTNDLATFRSQVNEIETALRDSFSNFRVGLASFTDAPCNFFGVSTDTGYELNLSLDASGTLADSLGAFGTRAGGGDGAEAQLEAMRQAITGDGQIINAVAYPSCSPQGNIPPTSPGWDKERVRFLLVSTDASFHRPTDSGYPYLTSVNDVIKLAQDAGITILFMNSGSTDTAAQQIATATGGNVYNLGSASEEIVETLRTAISSSITSVEVKMTATGDNADLVTFIDPEQITINLQENRMVSFDVTLSPNVGTSTEDRVFMFELITSAANAEISRLTVEVTVPGVI